MKPFLLALLFVAAIQAIAQPGYLGKKTTISYNAVFNPAVYGMVASDMAPFSAYKTQSFDGWIVFNYRHQLEADHVVGRMTSAGVGVFALRTASRNGIENMGYMGYKSVGGFAYLKLFKNNKRGAVAPVGPWGRVGAGYYSTTFLSDGFAGDTLLVLNPTTKAAAPMLLLSLGNSRVFSDRIVVNVCTDIILSGYPKKVSVLSDDFGDYPPQWRVPGHLTLNFSVGIGGLF